MNHKTNFARRQLSMRADARVRIFEKFTKNGHFSTYSKNFFATNCDFLTLTHPGDAMNHKTNFAQRQLFMRADARVTFFEKFRFFFTIWALIIVMGLSNKSWALALNA